MSISSGSLAILRASFESSSAEQIWHVKRAYPMALPAPAAGAAHAGRGAFPGSGAVRSSAGRGMNRYGFIGSLGRFRGEKSGCICLRPRCHRLVTGRFPSENSAEVGLNWHRYHDVIPTNFADESGKWQGRPISRRAVWEYRFDSRVGVTHLWPNCATPRSSCRQPVDKNYGRRLGGDVRRGVKERAPDVIAISLGAPADDERAAFTDSLNPGSV